MSMRFTLLLVISFALDPAVSTSLDKPETLEEDSTPKAKSITIGDLLKKASSHNSELESQANAADRANSADLNKVETARWVYDEVPKSKPEKEFQNITEELAKLSALAPAIGVALLPTADTEVFLKDQVVKAELLVNKTKAEAPDPSCKECGKYYHQEYALRQLPKSRLMEKIAKKRLADAEKWNCMEKRRHKALPQLLLARQRQAKVEHELTLAEETRALSLAVERAEYEAMLLKRMAPVSHAVARQRLVDRIRAAEDARVAKLALKAAEKAHKLKLKKIAKHTRKPGGGPCKNCVYE